MHNTQQDHDQQGHYQQDHTQQDHTQPDRYHDVAAIVTAMTDGEKPFLWETLQAVLSDPCIRQVILCVEERNTWLETVIGAGIADPRLQILRLPLMPLGAVRNRGLHDVQQPWVTYCDGDDVWCAGKTLAQRTFADRLGCDFVAVDHCLIDEAGKTRAFALARYLPMPSAWMVRTEVMRQHPFSNTLRLYEDGEWWSRTANVIQRARCPKILLRYRIRSGSLSSNEPSKQRKAKIVAFAKIPLLGFGVFFVTYCAWFLAKREQYLPLSN